MKIRKLIALSTLAVGFGAVVALAPVKHVQVRAEEETTVVEQVEQKQNRFIDEFLVPLVITLTSGNGVALIGMGVIGHIRNKKEKARNAKFDTLIDLLVDYIKSIDEAKRKVDEMVKILENSYGKSLSIIENEKAVLLSYKEDFEKIKGLKNVIVTMAEAQLAEIKGQAENVRSGLAHEIAEIEEKLKLLK